MKELAALCLVGLLAGGCCGCPTPAESPQSEPTALDAAPSPSPEAPLAEASKDETQPPEATTSPSPPASVPSPEAPPSAPSPLQVDPQFSAGMSVADAIKAVPQGAERANIDQETLSKPIQDFALYEPCKPGAAHLKLRVAVWEGKAVGIDVKATPKNDRLVACVKERIMGLTWQAHVKSLNTVEYSF